MKLAISAKCPGLGAQVSPRFGRCEYFVIVDSDKLESESIKNPNMGAMNTAGVKSSQMLADRKVQVILTDNVAQRIPDTIKRWHPNNDRGSPARLEKPFANLTVDSFDQQAKPPFLNIIAC